ncbi:MAG: hypothetical protein BKP49_03925 [Treponema sp. CETP13]|nr:MAG: hypothetical protein BKP49_03925 [Treponema sp. CETP13]
MKKLTRVFMVTMVVLLLAGCASTPKESAASEAAKTVVIGAEGIARPSWVLMGKESEDGIYAVGAGKMSTPQTSLKLAKANGRTELARQLNVEIQSALTTYLQDSGVGDQSQVINYMEEVSVQKTDAWLQGTKQVDYWLGADETVYVLMFEPYDVIVPIVNEELKEFTRNPAAEFAEDKAIEALKRYGFTEDNTPVEK